MAQQIEFSQTGIDQLNKSLNALVESMDRLEKAVKALDKRTNVLEGVFGSKKDLDNFIKAINELDKDASVRFSQLASSLRNMAKALKDLPEISTANTRDLLRSIKELFDGIGSIKVGDVGGLSTVSTAVRSAANTLKDVANTRVDSKRIKEFTSTFSDLLTSLMRLKSVQRAIPPIGSFEVVSRTIDQLGQGLVSLQKYANQLRPGQAKKISTSFASLTTFLRLAAALTDLIVPGRTALAELSTVFDKLGSGFAGIARASRQINGAVIRSLIASFTKLIAGLKIVSLALRLMPGGQALDTFTSAIGRLGTGLRALAKLGRDFRLDNSFFEIIRRFIEILKPFVFSLRGLAGKEVPDVGRVFAGLIEAAEKLGKSRIKKQDFDALRDVARSVVRSLNEFDSVRVDPDKLKAVASATEALSKIKPGSAEKTQFFAAGLGLGTSVRDGFLQALRIDRFRAALLGIASQIATLPARGFLAMENSARQAFSNITGFLNNTGAKVREVGDTIRNIGETILRTFDPRNIFEGEAFQSALNFDQLSSQARAFGNLTDEELKSAQDFSNEIGIKYPLSATEAMEATVNLIKAGLDLKKTFDVLPAAADLASSFDTPSIDAASNALIQVTSTFKNFTEDVEASFENASVAADILARAGNNSTASVEELNAGLANAGPTAAAYGLTLEETAAILGIFNDNGIRGAEAGTQLKSMLTNMTRDTPAVTAAWRELGISLTDSEGNFRSLNDVINDLVSSMNETRTVTVSNTNLTGEQRHRLQEAEKAYAAAARQIMIYSDGLNLSALDEEKAQEKIAEYQQIQRNAQQIIEDITGSQSETERITVEISRSQSENFKAIQTLAGTYGQAGLNILISQGEDAIRNFVNEMGRLPTAAEQAEILLDNLAGDAEQFRGAVETLSIKALLPLMNRALRPLIQVGQAVVAALTQLPDPILETAVNAAFLVTTFASLVGAFLVAAGVVAQFGGVLVSIVGGFLALGTSIPAILVGLAGFAASFGVLIVTATAVVGAVTAISAAITTVIRDVENNVGGAGDAFNKLRQTIDGIFESVGKILSIGRDIFNTLFGSALRAGSVERGERVAALLDRIRNSLNSFKSGLDNLAVFSRLLRDSFLVSGGVDFRKKFALDKFGKDLEQLDFNELFELSESLDTLTREYTAAVGAFSRTPLAKVLFGKNATPESVMAGIDAIRGSLLKLRDGFATLGSGIIDSIFGVEGGREKIESAFGNILSVATKGLGRVMGQDLSRAILAFDAGYLRVGIGLVTDKLVDTFREFILSKESIITDVLAGVFRSALPGGFFEKLFRSIGLTNIADALGGPLSAIENVFRSTIGTVFDLLRGQSLEEALIGNFGAGAGKALRAIQSIGRAFDKLVGIVVNFVSALFGGDTASDPEKNILSAIFDDVAVVFEDLDENVLQPILENIPGIVNAFRTILGVVGNAASGVLSFINRAGKPLIDVFRNVFKEGMNFSSVVEAVGGVLSNVFGAVPGLVGGAMVAVGNLIGSDFLTQLGDEISSGNFSDAISTVAEELASLVGRAAAAAPAFLGTALIGIGGLIGSPFLKELGAQIGSSQFTEALNTAAQALADLIGDAVAAIPPLLGTTFIGLGQLIGSPFLTELGVQIGTGDFSSVLNAAAQAFVDLIGRAIDLIGDLLGTALEGIGNQIGSRFLVKIGLDLQNNDFGAALGTAAMGIVHLIGQAIEAVPPLLGTALSNLGDTIGSPFLSKLGDDIANLDIAGLADTLADGIKDLFYKAITEFLPSKLTELGTLLNLSFLVDAVGAADGALIFERLGTALGNIAALPLETISAVTGNLEDFVELLQRIGPVTGAGLIASVVALSKLFTLLKSGNVTGVGAAIQLLKNKLVTGFSAIRASISRLIFSVGPMLTFVLLIKNAFSNLRTFLDGDIVGGIRDVFVGMAQDIAGFLGIDLSAAEIINNLTQVFSSVSFTIEILARRVANSVAIGTRNIFDGMIDEINEGRARADQALGFASTGTGDVFFRLTEGIENDFSFSQIAAALDEAAEKNLDLSPLHTRLRTQYAAIMDAFRREIPELSTLDDVRFGDVIKTLVGANAFDDALLEIPAEDLADFLERSLRTAGSEIFAHVDPNEIITQLEFLSASRQIDPEKALQIFDLLVLNGLADPAAIELIKNRLQETLQYQAEQVALGAGETKFEPEVEVEPELTLSEDYDPQQATRDLLNADRQSGSGSTESSGEAVEVTVPVSPELELSSEDADLQAQVDELLSMAAQAEQEIEPIDLAVPVTVATPEEAEALKEALEDVDAQTKILQQSMLVLSEQLATTSPAVSAFFTTMQTDLQTSQTEWANHTVHIGIQNGLAILSILGLQLVVNGLKSAVNTASTEIQTAASNIATGFEQMEIRGSIALETLKSKVLDLVMLMERGVTGFAQLGLVDGNPNPNVNPLQGVPGRRYGGKVFAGNLYEVAEEGVSELLQIGNRLFLIPGKDGMVIPPSDTSQVAARPEMSKPNYTNNASSTSNIVNNVSVTLSGLAPDDYDVRELAERIGEELDRKARLFSDSREAFIRGLG